MATGQQPTGAAPAKPAAPAAAPADTSLVGQILAAAQMPVTSESYDCTKRGVEALLTQLLTPERANERVDKAFADALIAEIDAKISKQLDEVLHAGQFQQLESAWRGLKYVIDNTNFDENIRVELLNCSKDDLMADFEDAPGITGSGLYKTVYSSEYGSFGGKPYGAIFANYEMSPSNEDIDLLNNVSAVAAMAHAPFFAAAGPSFVGETTFLTLPNLKDLQAILEGPEFARWHGFREAEDARYVGLTLPRFLLRLPYGRETLPVKQFDYEESVIGNHQAYLWGNTSFALATRLAGSFAKYHWCPNIIGPTSGGSIYDLPLHTYEAMGEIQMKCPTEVAITERREFELSEQGFIPLTYRKESDNACFFSANSCQQPLTYGQSPEGRAAELNYRLGTQFPYLLVITRLAHYIKVIEREQLGTWKERIDLERELNKWIGQYVADMDGASPAVRGRRPLRKAKVTVTDVEGNAGWYRCDVQVRPHFKYMGAYFTLSLVGKLEK